MKKLTSLILAAAIAAPMTMQAIPARPGLRTVTQPDGTTLQVELLGDEFHHVYRTADGLPLGVGADGAYYYMTVATDGSLQLSNVIAADKAMRTPAVNKMLAGYDATATFAKLTERREAALERNAAMVESNLALRAPSRADDDNDLPITAPGNMLINNSVMSTGAHKMLVVLVQFTNKKFVNDDPHSYFVDFMNKEGFDGDGATGSCRDYYLAASRGQLELNFDVYGPLTLAHDYAYYGRDVMYDGNDACPGQMAIEALKLIDDDVDLSQYDCDGDGYIDNIAVIYAGGGQATSNDSDTVWPHSADLIAMGAGTKEECTFDNVVANHYIVLNEYDVFENRMAGIGTFCHEFGHALGLPDLYCTTYGEAAQVTPGPWSIMDSGSYNNNSRTPPIYSSYEAYCMGWLKPKLIDQAYNISLEALTTGEAFLIATPKASEFFLFENRQKVKGSWDYYLPASGMLIWHIDFLKSRWKQNSVNNTASHQYIDIVEANNNPKPTLYSRYVWPGSLKRYTSFTFDTKPSFQTWRGVDLELPLTDIEMDDETGLITFKVAGGGPEYSGIEEITVDNSNAPVEYFNLQGARISHPEAGSIVIRRQGTEVTKIRF